MRATLLLAAAAPVAYAYVPPLVHRGPPIPHTCPNWLAPAAPASSRTASALCIAPILEEQDENAAAALEETLALNNEDADEHEPLAADEEGDAAAAVPSHDPDRPPISMFNVDAETVADLASQGIENFTPIQAQSYDLLRSGRDMLARSRTGTGKTLAFSLPIVQRLAASSDWADGSGRPERGRLPRMLVLAPTRELAKQVGTVIEGLGKHHRLYTAVFTGGTPCPPQQRALRNGIDVLVGTPGRIIDHLQSGELDLSGLEAVVLDEADEMLNMGFKDDVETILAGSNEESRQTVLFSATHPPWVKDVSRQYQTEPSVVDAVGRGQSEAATTVEHRAVLTPGSDIARCSTLADIIAVYGGDDESRTIVFTSTKREADELCVSAPLAPLSPQPLHGDVSQTQRDVTLKRFREGHFNVLVATDVAARGIDISGVDLIVQYRMPQDPDSYVHRSGRTGRAGRNGVSLILYSEREQRELRNLEHRANVRFSKDGPPSIAKVMDAAVGLVPRRLAVVRPKVADYFRESAQALLESDAAVDDVARALALVAGKADLTERSLLTGEDHMTTLLVKSTDGTPLTPGDVMGAVSALGDSANAGGDRPGDHVGKIRNCQDATQVRPAPRLLVPPPACLPTPRSRARAACQLASAPPRPIASKKHLSLSSVSMGG